MLFRTLVDSVSSGTFFRVSNFLCWAHFFCVEIGPFYQNKIFLLNPYLYSGSVSLIVEPEFLAGTRQFLLSADIFLSENNLFGWIRIKRTPKGVCHEILTFIFDDSNPAGPLINKFKHFRIQFGFR